MSSPLLRALFIVARWLQSECKLVDRHSLIENEINLSDLNLQQ